MQGFGQIIRITVAALLALSITACSATFRNHGYMPADEEIDMILIGVDNRETLGATIGAPGTSGLLTEGAWYYVQSRFKHLAYNAPEEIDRQVLAVSFDANGLVANVERFGLDEGRVIALSRRVTDSNIKDLTFLSQLFSSFGRFDASTLL